MADTTATSVHGEDEAHPLLGIQNDSSSPTRDHLGWARWSMDTYLIAQKAAISSKTYPLLFFIPLSIISGLLHWTSVLTTISSILAIIPLSALVSYSSDLLSKSMGDLIGGLINATFGNSVELSIGILAVYHGQFQIAQTVMIGSILSDILLGLGTCIFTASYFGRHSISFKSSMTDALSSLMTITAVALILPTALYSTVSVSGSPDTADKILAFSRGSSVVLLLLYILFLYFQLFTHTSLFEPESSTSSDESNLDVSKWSSVAVLLASAICIVICTHMILQSIPETSKQTHLTSRFIAAIFVPIASNAPEFVTIFTFTRSGRVDFVMGVITESILQIALLAIPFLVTLGWILGREMTLNFETCQTTLLLFAVLVVNRLLKDDEYTYLQGLMLVEVYAVITLAFYIRPDIKVP